MTRICAANADIELIIGGSSTPIDIGIENV